MSLAVKVRTSYSDICTDTLSRTLPKDCQSQTANKTNKKTGTPEPESDKPGAQPTREVRVLDIFLHQLPVARNTLAVISQESECSAIKQAVKVSQHRGLHEVLKRLDIRIKTRKDHAAAKRHALKVAFQGLASMMVGADKFLLVAMELPTELHAAVRAHILDYIDIAINGTDHDHRTLANHRTLKVACI
jgi:hypothetical protein